MRNEKLVEATMLALRGKLNEVYIKEYVETFDELYNSSWGPAIEVLDRISELNLEDELMDWLEDLGTEDTPIDRTELNDYIIFQAEDIYEALGLDENGDPLDENKKTENKNDIMSFEDWVDYIDIKKSYPDWFKDKKELDRPFLNVINDHMEELERDYKNYRGSVSKKKTEATMLALRGKLNEWEEEYEDDYGKGITTRWYEVEVDDGFLDEHFEDENEAIKVARTYEGDVYVYVTGSERYTTGDYKGYSEPLDSVLLWQRVNGEEKKFGNSNAILEARSHKEDNEKVVPRIIIKKTEMKNDVEVKCIKTYIEDAEEYWSEGNYYQAKKLPNNEWEVKTNLGTWGRIGDAYTIDDINEYFIVSPNQQSKEHKKTHNEITRESKKIIEVSTDVNEVIDDYKKAYGKDLDLKNVPCVIARDKMLSGWGGAEGRNHYQVVLCADSTEAHNIAYKMQAEAEREQLANVRVSFGVKLPSKVSVAYCVGRYASAWNMGDSWYERYDTKVENKSIKVKGLRKFEGVRAVEEYEYEFDDLYDIVGENGKSVLDDIRNANKEDEFIDYLISIMGEDTGKLPTVGELSDFIDYDFETIFRDLEMETENKKTKTKNKSIKVENVQGNSQGICPKCGSMITNYGEIFWDDEGIGQVFDCTNPECKAHGIEYYNTTFDYIEVEEN